MKKTIILLAAVFAAHLVSIAQNTRVGFTAGVSMSNYKITADNLSIKGDTKAGITFGVLVDAPLSDHLSLQPALNFIQKGLNNTNDLGGGVTEKSKSTINLIEVPVNFLYNSNGKGGNFFVGAGPSLGFGISGNSRTTYSDGTPEESSKIKFGNTIDDDLKGLDLGANLLAGYCLKGGFMFSVNYNLGLSNLVPKPEGNEKMKSHYIGIKLGWMLAGDQKKKKD
ncbi:MAG: PorT family protein [Chitinophagaceae bacterium]|nr:PorT family protein [Chitinophagaceae bacterium]